MPAQPDTINSRVYLLVCFENGCLMFDLLLLSNLLEICVFVLLYVFDFFFPVFFYIYHRILRVPYLFYTRIF